MYRYLPFLLLLMTACIQAEQQPLHIEYEPNTQDFLNPERGFYRPMGTLASDFRPLNEARLLRFRSPQPAAGGFEVSSSLTYRGYQLDLFQDQAISADFLEKMQADFDLIRLVGNKMILRIYYSDKCCDPPFGDVSLSRILEHLGQLAPLFSKNQDVIALVQMGLIGPWGEQFYSDYFGDLEHGPVTPAHWEARNQVIDSLLGAVPETRMVQVRAPYYKLRYLEGPDAHPEAATPLSAATAFNGSKAARLGHHNDCILANYDDYWTYHSFHEWPAVSDTLHLKAYIAAETKYVVFGGETCPGGANGEDVYDPYNNCEVDGGGAESYLRRFHTSYLNAGYARQINGDWKGKCIDDIKKSLGYRFELLEAIVPSSIEGKEAFSIRMRMINRGYASPYNARKVELVLKRRMGGEVYKIPLDADPRLWFPNEEQEINAALPLPAEMASGVYDLFLNLPDPFPSLYSRAAYSIRLANRYQGADVWDQQTGWNRLFAAVEIKS